MTTLPTAQPRTAVGRVGLLLVIVAVGLSYRPASPPRLSGAAKMYQLTPTPIAVLPPGTVVPNGPPEGWTHLIIKSRSRVHSGDVDHLSDTLKHLASFLSSALVLRISPPSSESPNYRLDEVAFGISTRIDGKDTIISSSTQAQLGAKLGFMERTGLARAEARLSGLLVAARSDTMIVLDAPTQLLRNGRHRVVIFRSCVLLDRPTGGVETVTYAIDLDGSQRYGDVISPVSWLAPNCEEEILLHVDANEFVLGLITEKALAMPHLTKGQMHLSMPDEWKPLAAQQVFTVETFEELERRLRDLLANAPGS